MPIQKCSKDGISGWQYGRSGECYVGKDGKKKAIRQGLAEVGPDKFRQEMKASANRHELEAVLEAVIDDQLSEPEEIVDAMTALGYAKNQILMYRASAYVSKKKRDSIGQNNKNSK